MFLAASYVHDLSPFALDLGGGFGIRWYGLSYLAGIVAAWLIIGWLARTGRSLLRPEQVGDFMISRSGLPVSLISWFDCDLINRFPLLVLRMASLAHWDAVGGQRHRAIHLAR